MFDDFRYDVFLSHSEMDREVARDVAERLHADGLRVWFLHWELKPGDNIASKIEAGLEESRVLVLCLSAHTFGPGWAQLESRTFRFRDPLNKERRFIPLRLDESPIRGSLAQFAHLSWLPGERDEAYTKLLNACRPPSKHQDSEAREPSSRKYTNAKVVLVGDSGAGKTGLSKRLALGEWEPTESTVSTWATQWKLPVYSRDEVEREIWLWDFGGLADQHLIHQLYMDDAALAVLVFDGQREDLFETLSRWDRDLTRATRQSFTKLLVAGRVDAGGLRVNRSRIEAFAQERGYSQFLETSARTSAGCLELRQAIIDGIRWDEIPWRSSPRLFRQLKVEIIKLKDEGRVLMRFVELRETLRLRLPESDSFADEELRAVVGLLSTPGVVWELAFGSWVLLQPEWINYYAHALIRTLREDRYERGAIPEQRVLNGELAFDSSGPRLPADEERFVLLAMHQTLVERGLCLRENTDDGPLLIFPSYYRRERPELTGHPAVLFSYRFNGFLDDIYATLVVRLHHTGSFEADELWRYAADFKSLSQGRRLGVKLTRRGEGAGELEVYFDPDIPVGEKMIFSRYVHEHLLKKGNDVVRLRYYVCPNCETPVRDRETAMKRLAERGKQANILCVNCEKRIPLWDDLEEMFARPETKQRVRELQEQLAVVLDNESRERALVGEVISTVSLAGQICREFITSDHGIDMEVEFKDDTGQPTGKKVYLQLKAGDSYLRKRRKDGAEIFTVKEERWVRYWMEQAFPVMLVVRTSDGEIRWMEVRDWLRRASDGGKKTVKQIVFSGERFDVVSVRRWREPMMRESLESLAAQATESPDPRVRRTAIEQLATTSADAAARELLSRRGLSDEDDGIRALVVNRLAALWPDEKTRDLLLGVAERDGSGDVRATCCEELSRLWWAELKVRQWLRARTTVESGDAIRQRLIRTVESAGAQLSDFWVAKLSAAPGTEKEPEMLPGYPAFRASRIRLHDIGPFRQTKDVELGREVNVFLGDNAAGKTTLLRCLALAAVGSTAANEIENNPSAYLRKGAQRGSIEVLFELVPDPGSSPAELSYFTVGLQITAGSSRFTPLPNSEMTMRRPDQTSEPLPNSAESLGALRSGRPSPFGFVSGYGAVRMFQSSPLSLQGELGKRENEWVRSLFDPEAPLVNPGVLSKFIRGDMSNVEDAPPGGVLPGVLGALRASLGHLFPEVKTFFEEGEHDLQLNGTPLRFAELSDGYRSLFALMGHLLRCSLKARDWKDDPTGLDGIALIDEMDLHLHPEWQRHVVEDFRRAFPNIQLIASTHSPLVVGALKRQDVLIMRRDEDGSVTVERPEFDPQGQGVAGILTSIFDLSSTIDNPTLDKINRRLALHSRREDWDEEDARTYEELSGDLARLGFNREFSDPYFERFATAMANRHKLTLEKLTPREKFELDAYAADLLAEILGEGGE